MLFTVAKESAFGGSIPSEERVRISMWLGLATSGSLELGRSSPQRLDSAPLLRLSVGLCRVLFGEAGLDTGCRG